MPLHIRQADDSSYVGFQIAPMVDVVLMLILFFMASAAMQIHEQELSMNLPGLGNETPPMTFEIQISANGLVACGAEGAVSPVDSPTDTELRELVGKIQYVVQHNGEKTPIIVNPDGDAPHQRVVDVLNACVKGKAQNISFAG